MTATHWPLYSLPGFFFACSTDSQGRCFLVDNIGNLQWLASLELCGNEQEERARRVALADERASVKERRQIRFVEPNASSFSTIHVFVDYWSMDRAAREQDTNGVDLDGLERMLKSLPEQEARLSGAKIVQRCAAGSGESSYGWKPIWSRYPVSPAWKVESSYAKVLQGAVLGLQSPTAVALFTGRTPGNSYENHVLEAVGALLERGHYVLLFCWSGTFPVNSQVKLPSSERLHLVLLDRFTAEITKDLLRRGLKRGGEARASNSKRIRGRTKEDGEVSSATEV